MESVGQREAGTLLRMLVIGIAVAGLVAGCGASAGDMKSEGAKKTRVTKRTVTIAPAGNNGRIRPVPWRATPRPGAKAVNLLTAYNWCDGSSQPRVQRVEIVERKQGAVLTVLVFFPFGVRSGAHNHENERHYDASCTEVRLIAATKVALRRSAFDQMLYDGSTSPPTKRWPKD